MRKITNWELENIVMDSVYNEGMRIKELAYQDLDIKWKKKDDPVTKLDKEAEQNLIRYIESQGVDATFYGEEYGVKKGSPDIKIYIDPIDGTKSFIKKEFHSSTSVAVERKGKLILGFVYDFMKNVMYYANNEGAYIIAPGRQKFNLPLKGMPRFSRPNIEVRHFDDKYANRIDCRLREQQGSVALSMAELAAGSNNGIIMAPYQKNGTTDTCDIAAGYLIMKQAGLYIKSYDLKKFDYKDPHFGIIALEPWLKDKILK